MPTLPNKQKPQSSLAQLVFNFVIPIFILMRFSSASSLGPIKAMLLALAFPVAFELRSIYVRHKVSVLSLVSIGGIFVTGAISLLGLSEGWLAIRRSLPYFAISLALLIAMAFRYPLVDMLLARALHMDKAKAAAEKNHNNRQLKKTIRNAALSFVLLFLAIGISSYILTLVTISAPPKTELFNSQYARLRILALPFTTLPTFVGITGIFLYLVFRIEKLTGIESTELMKNATAKDPEPTSKPVRKGKKTR